jgi:hypothetical protein
MNIDSKMEYKNEAMKESLKSVSLDVEEVKKIIANLKSL